MRAVGSSVVAALSKGGTSHQPQGLFRARAEPCCGIRCCRWLQPKDSLQLLLNIAEVDEFLESRLGLNAAERALIFIRLRATFLQNQVQFGIACRGPPCLLSSGTWL
jgi:hypothetical protein